MAKGNLPRNVRLRFCILREYSIAIQKAVRQIAEKFLSLLTFSLANLNQYCANEHTWYFWKKWKANCITMFALLLIMLLPVFLNS